MMPVSEPTPLDNLQAPAALRDLKQWLVWKFEPNPKHGKKDLKVPHYAKSGTKRGWFPGVRGKKIGQGSEEEMPLLVTFEEAKAAAIQRGMEGVGLAMVAGCPVTALDFDHCVADGVIHPDVEALIAGTYAEISPSGKGVRAFVKGALGDRSDAHPDDGSFGFETYSSSRFVTFTGNMTPDTVTFGCENEVAEPSALLLETCEKRFGPRVIRQVSIGKSDKERVGLTDGQIKEVLQWTAGGDYKRWLAIGAALHHETEGEGEWLWDEWSQGIADYEGPDEIRYKWSTMGNYSGDEKTFWSVLREAQALGCPVTVGTASPDEFESLPMPKGGTYQIESWEEVRARPRKTAWLIKGFLPKAVLGVLFGASTAGKSFVALDMACAIARGEDWNGHRVNKGRVLYVVAEGADGFIRRMDAYDHQYGVEKREVDLITGLAPNLTDAAQVTNLIKDIKQREPYAIIIMDTFAQMTAGTDENSGKDMGLALDQCKRISLGSGGAMVLLVHHSGKDASKGSRGHSSLKAACDVELEVTRTDEVRAIKANKIKDGRDGIEHGFKLTDVILGLDEDGDAITSCVVEYGSASHGMPSGKNEVLLLTCLHELIGLGGRSRISEEELLTEAKAKTANAGRDTKSNLKKALTALAAKNYVVRHENWVSPIESAENAGL